MAVDQHLIETLSDREMDVLRLMAEGKTNPEIGEALGIRFQTAKWYVSEVLQKLQVPTREAAAAEYRRYNRAPARLRRAMAGVPLFVKWGGAGAAVLATAAILFAVLTPSFRSGSGEQWLIAWVNSDLQQLRRSEVDLEPIHIIDARTGDTWDLGAPDLWGGVMWSPAGDRLLAMRRPAELVLLSYPEGEILDFDGPDLSAYARPINQSDPNAEAQASLSRVDWSPDGEWFFVAGALYNKNGELVWQREGIVVLATWSPDGEMIAIGSETEVAVVAVDGSLLYSHDALPFNEDADSFNVFSQWLSEDILAVPVANSSIGAAYAELDVSLSPPVLGPPQPFGSQPLEISPGYAAARQLIQGEAGDEQIGVVEAGVTDGTAVTTIGAIPQDPNNPPRQIDIIVANPDEMARVTIEVNWTFPGTVGPWGTRVSFVIRD